MSGDYDEDFDDAYEMEDDGDADCHAGSASTIIGAWQRCGMAGTEYCDWECSFARRARAEIAEQREKRKAKRRSHTPDLLETPSPQQAGR